MSTESKNGPPTVSDVFYAVIFSFVLLFVTSLIDSCHAGFSYRDLRDRLERLEQRQ